MWQRFVVAFLEGVVREAGGRAVDYVEQWIEDRRPRRDLDLNRCKDCGRVLCCAIHGADPRLVATEVEAR